MDGDRNISEIISDIRDNCELAKAANEVVELYWTRFHF